MISKVLTLAIFIVAFAMMNAYPVNEVHADNIDHLAHQYDHHHYGYYPGHHHGYYGHHDGHYNHYGHHADHHPTDYQISNHELNHLIHH